MQRAPPRLYTLDEACGRVAWLQQRFNGIDEHLGSARTLGDQVADLEIVWGSKLLEEGCPERADYMRFKAELEGHEKAVDGQIKEITGQGIEVKDVFTGLIDFYARRGPETVYLCWKRGETTIGWWHTLQAGFAGRRPISEF